MATLQQAIDALNSAAAAYNGKVGEIDQAVLDGIAEVSAHVNSSLASIGPYNYLVDSGRLFDTTTTEGQTSLTLTTLDPTLTMNADPFIAYNGSVFSDGGRYTSGSITFGGARDACNESVELLLNAMRNSNSERLHGVEFNILESTQGIGTGAPDIKNPSNFLAFSLSATPAAETTTIGFWLRCVSGEVSTRSHFVDGIEEYNKVLAAEDGWKHISMLRSSVQAYVTSLSIYASPGSVLQVALPFLCAGDFRGFVHGSPIIK